MEHPSTEHSKNNVNNVVKESVNIRVSLTHNLQHYFFHVSYVCHACVTNYMFTLPEYTSIAVPAQ